MTLDGVRALVFDVFGTVVDWRSGVAYMRKVNADGLQIVIFFSAFATSRV